MKSDLEGGVEETVEKLVDKYLTIFEKTYEETERLIKTNWEMSREDIDAALWWLKNRYGNLKSKNKHIHPNLLG